MDSLTTWSGMFTFAATTGIITALLSQTLGFFRDRCAVRAKRKSEAGYLALRLAAILEGYGYDCASFIEDNAHAEQGPDDEFPAWKLTLPALPPFPEEKEGWHSIDLKLAARALELRNHIASRQGVIGATAEFNEDDLGDDLDEHAGALGQQAWTLAKDLRSSYGLPPFVPIWNYLKTLENALLLAKKAKEERASNQAEMLQELAADDARHQIS